MKYTSTFMSVLVIGLFSSLALARSPSLSSTLKSPSAIPKGLSCAANVKLPAGKSQAVPVYLGDHVMFGPVASGGLQEGGQSTAVPLESVGFVGMILESTVEKLVVLSIEARLSKTIFEPELKEDQTLARGVIVLSRKIKELAKGGFSVMNLNGGEVAVECELK